MILRTLKKMFGKKPAEKKIKKEVKEEEALVLYEDKTYENERETKLDKKEDQAEKKEEKDELKEYSELDSLLAFSIFS